MSFIREHTYQKEMEDEDPWVYHPLNIEYSMQCGHFIYGLLLTLYYLIDSLVLDRKGILSKYEKSYDHSHHCENSFMNLILKGSLIMLSHVILQTYFGQVCFQNRLSPTSRESITCFH